MRTTQPETFDPGCSVSSRCPTEDPNTTRYAVIEGQHRWATVTSRDPRASIAARVGGLSVAEEAELFLGIDIHRGG